MGLADELNQMSSRVSYDGFAEQKAIAIRAGIITQLKKNNDLHKMSGLLGAFGDAAVYSVGIDVIPVEIDYEKVVLCGERSGEKINNGVIIYGSQVSKPSKQEAIWSSKNPVLFKQSEAEIIAQSLTDWAAEEGFKNVIFAPAEGRLLSAGAVSAIDDEEKYCYIRASLEW